MHACRLCRIIYTPRRETHRRPPACRRNSPEAQGVSSSAIRHFVEATDRQVNAMNSFMLVRHGHVVTEGWWTPYAAEVPHVLYSLSKSFTSTAVGLAVSEGKLSIDDEVLKFFPDDAPSEPTNNLKTVLDYLRPRLFEPLGIENPTLGHKPAGNFPRRLRTESSHRRHCQVRAALFAEGPMAGQTQ